MAYSRRKQTISPNRRFERLIKHMELTQKQKIAEDSHKESREIKDASNRRSFQDRTPLHPFSCSSAARRLVRSPPRAPFHHVLSPSFWRIDLSQRERWSSIHFAVCADFFETPVPWSTSSQPNILYKLSYAVTSSSRCGYVRILLARVGCIS